ncbi:pseudouridine synthase [Amylocystis lapponica]|nr:pseudouridine synthase [Amylocystis lapponica]
MSPSPHAYDAWTREDLISRLRQLDGHPTKPIPARQQKAFDFSAHSRRKIALKFSYNGAEYGGLEFQKPPTRLPTVEGVLFDALAHTRLIDPAGGFEGCGWEKCGRTDRGVSAAGQVVSLWVRSAMGEKEAAIDAPTPQPAAPVPDTVETRQTVDGSAEESGIEGDFDLMGDWDEPPSNASQANPSPSRSELHYVSSLNNVLPPTIRVIAWSPVSLEFSARFSCRYRHYKYLFSSQGLDVSAMQSAAELLVGEHDFRNMCKLDPSKQLTTFKRRILSARINPVQSGALYVFDLIGTAFLYNQVRHIMAVLFLVGTRLEHPSIVSALLNIDPEHPLSPETGQGPLPVVVTKPEYQMADALPLMLWECGYEESAVNWRTDGDDIADDATAALSQRDFSNNLYQGLQSLHERSEIHTALDAHFLRAAAQYHSPPPQYFPLGRHDTQAIPEGSVLSIPLGAGTFRRGANYVPLLKRPRGEMVELVNERWRVGKGARQMERRAAMAQGGGDV